MKLKNRPYSAINVYDNLHGKIKKASVQKALDALVESGDL
jgi:26S proteasome regulatory subunit (ATPase 3-interacting protein)